MTDKKDTGEVVSFEKAGRSHVYARAEKKLEKAQKAFKAVIRKKLKEDRIEARKSKSKKKKPGKKK